MRHFGYCVACSNEIQGKAYGRELDLCFECALSIQADVNGVPESLLDRELFEHFGIRYYEH
jgi:hypothetical protein